MTRWRTVCPLNCPDSCTLWVEPGSEGFKIKGDDNPITQGFVCKKGLAYAEKAVGADRIHFPLLKEQGYFKRISWDQAYEVMIQKVEEVIADTGPLGILHLFDYAHSGVLRGLDRRFFECLGGSTEPSGSMCWGAGYEAITRDFGAVYSSPWADLEKARLIVLWGRDPAVTNLHLVPYLLRARRNGAHIVVINPIRVKSCDFADEFIQVRPGTDVYLALGLGHILLRERWLDLDFVRAHVSGFEPYARLVGEISLPQVAALTGVDGETRRRLARLLRSNSPVSFVLGYGLQRYVHGGETVRAIDALAAITGNIGRPGAGIHYAHQYHWEHLNSLSLPPGRYRKRTIPHARLAEQLDRLDPPIKLVVVTRSNPLVQQPDSALWREKWAGIPFKITFDYVLSETARASDLVLPITTIFEEEELIATSWSPFLQYVEPVMAARGESKPEPVIFIELAQRMGLKDFAFRTPREGIEYVIQPLAKHGITLDTLKAGVVLPSYIPEVAWADKQFKTPSGKVELLDALPPELKQPLISPGPEDGGSRGENAGVVPPGRSEYPWFLLTPHPQQSIHSQFMDGEFFRIWVLPQLGKQRHLRDGDWALVETETGQLKGRVVFSTDIHPEAVVIPEGAVAEGLGVNSLIKGKLSTMGDSTCYYDVRCEIRKYLVD